MNQRCLNERKLKQLFSLIVAALMITLLWPQSIPASSSLVAVSNAAASNSAKPQIDSLKKTVEEFTKPGSDVTSEESNSGLTSSEKQTISTLTATTSWLGPMAPVALSPFFGLTLLSGIACYGRDFFPENSILTEGSVLANPVVFWTFLVLTILTSLPKFSKVSKPVAQLADFLETYAVVITLIGVKVLSHVDLGAEQTGPAQAGLLSMSLDFLLLIAMVINVIVINSVKFFFEFLIWITPVPFLDACFEVANKSLCCGLMAIYAFSPALATVINILVFVVCLIIFRWARRREIFYRSVVWDWVAGVFDKSRTQMKTSVLTVFPKKSVGSIPSRCKCILENVSANEWQLTFKRWFRKPLVETIRCNDPVELKKGLFTNALLVNTTIDGSSQQNELTFSRRYNEDLQQVCDNIQVVLQENESLLTGDSRAEFA